VIKQIKHKNLLWLDLTNPTKEEVESLSESFKIHPFIRAELRQSTPRPKIDLYDEAIFLVLHFPNENSTRKSDGINQAGTKEVDFVLGQNFIITTHYEEIQTLEEFAKILEASESLSQRHGKKLHAGYLFYYIIRQLYESLEPGLHFINDNLKRIEQKIFNDQEKEMVKTLSNINHCLLDFRWTLKDHEEILHSLEAASREFYGENFDYPIQSIISDYRKVMNNLENNEQAFRELRIINESMLNIKNNEIIKNLTILAFIFLPATMIGTIFGMSGTDFNMPIIKNDYGFWISFAMMIVTAIFSYLFVKFKKWL
jgi:magnesium transporter